MHHDILIELTGSPRVDLTACAGPEIPHTWGVYCFWFLDDHAPAYVGSATGKYGLRGRIARQHLNPIYLESRESVWSSKDVGQVAKQVMHNGKVVIEKSYFRKQLARRHDLVQGAPCLEYLRRHFSLSYFELAGSSAQEIKTIEDLIIEQWDPTYNR
jgi:hypothetical protein